MKREKPICDLQAVVYFCSPAHVSHNPTAKRDPTQLLWSRYALLCLRITY